MKKYGKIPLLTNNDVMPAPFEVVHLDMVGPWTIKIKLTGKRKKRITHTVQALTMVDGAINWLEIAEAPTKESEAIAKMFDNEWLCRYPRPRKAVHDNENEFTGFEFQEMCSSYGVKTQPTTVKNPRSNSVAERSQLTMGDMLRTMEFNGPTWKLEVNDALQSQIF